MKYEELIVLLPCHSLEDFPTHHEGDEAEGLLAAWSALWHPALIASAGSVPTWFRADGPPDALTGRLLVIPELSDHLLLAGFTARAASEGAHVVRKLTRRDQILAAALEGLDGGAGQVDPSVAADFLALGTCYLLVELLTRQMRYMSNVDEVHLKNEAVAAAQAAVAGNNDEAREHLRHCFETLVEARERFYPVNSYLIDLTLVAPTTLGQPLRDELNDDLPKNVLLSGQTLDRLAREEPQTLDALRLALDHKRVSVIGGDFVERETPLLPLESVLSELRRGLKAYESALGSRPVVYGRRRFGLSPVLPQILTRLGFDGALHLTLDDGQFPNSPQAKTRWEGLDANAIDAVCRLPLDANRPETFVALPRTIGESMDMDHVATVVLAHWPGQTNTFYEDLRRMHEYGPVLGKFTTLAEYFANTDRPGELTQFKPDQYRAPYLRQAIIREEAEPLSRRAGHERRRWQAEAAQTLGVLADLLDKPASPPSLAEAVECADADNNLQRTAQLDAELPAQFATATQRLAAAVAGSGAAKNTGCFVANPLSFARRVMVDVTSLETPPTVEGPVVAVQQSGSQQFVFVDVPACGFAWFAPGPAAEATRAKRAAKEKPSAEGLILRNELFEAHVHQETGGLRGVYNFAARGNQLSMQLAYRLPSPRPKPGEVWRDPDLDAVYSVMAADSIEVTAAGQAWGEIVSCGRVMDLEGRKLAGFTQTYRLERGSRVLMVDIELDIVEPPRADPWNSYYAARFAWGDSTAALHRSVALADQTTTAKRLESPHFVDIRSDKNRVAVLTGGLPYHRYDGQRMLDSLLVVRGESQRKFRLGIGVDLAHPAQAALDLLVPATQATRVPVPGADRGAGWLFHIDAKNIVATHWESIVEGARVAGVRVRLLETEGRAGRVHLRALRPPHSARQVDFLGASLGDLQIEADRVLLDIGAYEWVELELLF